MPDKDPTTWGYSTWMLALGFAFAFAGAALAVGYLLVIANNLRVLYK